MAPAESSSSRAERRSVASSNSSSGLRGVLLGSALFVLGNLVGYDAGLRSTAERRGGGGVASVETRPTERATAAIASSSSHPPPPPRPTARFVFLIGTEGSGHHLFRSLYKESPSNERMDRWGLSDRVRDVGGLLWNEYQKHRGIWTVPCAQTTPRGRKRKTGGVVVESGPSTGGSDAAAPPGVKDLIDELVGLLKSLDGAIRDRTAVDEDVPSDASTFVQLNFGRNSGQMSYPNFGGPCRFLKFPDVGVLHRACDLAGVSCQHVVVYRDPYEVIRSTTVNRHMTTTSTGPKLYATMLDVINAQMLRHPDRLAACWDYNRVGGGILEVGKLMGWNEADFSRFYKTLYVPSEPMNATERSKIVPDSLGAYMDTMVKATERVNRTCNEQFRRKGG